MSPLRWRRQDDELRAVLDGALSPHSPRFKWAGTLARLIDRRTGMKPVDWRRFERVIQRSWRRDGETGPRALLRRDVCEFASMCHRAATPDESIDGLLHRERVAFAAEVSKAADFLAERLSRRDVTGSLTWEFQPHGSDYGEFLVSLGQLREYAETWASQPTWRARQASGLVYFAHSLREQMRARSQSPRPDWHVIHAAAVAVLEEGAVPESIGPTELPAHLRRLTAASRPPPWPGG